MKIICSLKIDDDMTSHSITVHIMRTQGASHKIDANLLRDVSNKGFGVAQNPECCGYAGFNLSGSERL
ncbi:unnamed protein product [Arabidopsis thaliana]|uniref:Uncharacterized protein n=1 Tax=Arabidopsis thaliana TaxID=3702 RepID=A0A5S9X1Y7_ARATH|nr:unnamed protein product [Arabidopsis thaliana]